MNFRPELAAAVMAGDKTVTRRLTSANPNSPWFVGRCALNVGQAYAVCPGRGKVQIGKAEVVAVTLATLGDVDDAEARAEGFADRDAFVEAWTAINGAYDPAERVWRIELRAVRP